MSREQTARGPVLKTEASAAQFIPYTSHADPHTVKTTNGDFIRVIKLDGIAHETSDIDEINTWLEGRNNVWRNIANGSRAIWTTVIRDKFTEYPDDNFDEGFAKNFNERYRAKVLSKDLFVNTLYVVVIERNISELPFFGNLFSRLDRKNREREAQDNRKALKSIAEASDSIVSSFGRYGPKLLGTYEYKEQMYSEVLEYFAHIVNGISQRIPLSRQNTADILCNSRISFGNEAFEIRSVKGTNIGAILGLKEYRSSTTPGMLDSLLKLPFKFIMTQSFTFVSKPSSVSQMTMHRDRMIQSSDLAESQIIEINDALDDLTSSRFVMGDHHFTLTAFGNNTSEATDNLALASAELGDMGFVTAREDLAMEAAYWAQLPANFSYRPRKSLITSRNFAGLASFHNYPLGRISGNAWGPAVSLLRTTSGTPYYFNLHPGHGEAPTGSMTVIGPSGSGKTVFMGFLLSQCEKYKPQVVFFDKDRGAEIFIRAQGGDYTAIRQGRSTGFNPLQLETTPRNRSFFIEWLRLLATSNGESISVEDDISIETALRGFLELDISQRSLSNLIPFFDSTHADGIGRRLSVWTKGSNLGWAFDNESDSLDLENRILGFDITELLDKPQIRTPMLFYLFHRIEDLINGQKITIYIDEAWKAVNDKVFVLVINDWLKTIRKRSGLLVFGTQSAKDAAESTISDSIIEQTATNVFMPNPKAKAKHYIDGFGLSQRELETIRTLPEKSRKFLIRQGLESVVVEMNLAGLEDDIRVLSGTERNTNILDQVRTELGSEDPNWLPVFLERSK